MAKKLALLLVFVALAGGAVAYTALSDEEATDTTTSSESSQETSGQESESTAAETQNTGTYVDYNTDALATAEGQKVLFFHASWCPQCRSIESGIQSDGVPEGFTVLKVDYDSNQDLRQKYGVSLQTTFVKVDDQGNKIDSFVAYSNPTFQAVVNDYLLN